MVVAKSAIYILELIFGIGMAGSAVVILLTAIEDLGEIRNRGPQDESGSATSEGD